MMMKFSSLTILSLLTGNAMAFLSPHPHGKTTSAWTRLSVVTEPPTTTTMEQYSDKEPETVFFMTDPTAPAPKIEVDSTVVDSDNNNNNARYNIFNNSNKRRTQPLEPGRYDSLENSIAVPILPRPPHLRGDHAGDYGFDPCGVAQIWDLYTMQECELRHARLAMLAVVGWPLSELLAPDFMLSSEGRVPSVLNGFPNPIAAVSVLAILGALGYLETQTALRRTAETTLGEIHRRDMQKIWDYGVAGDYDFDPLGLYNSLGDDAYGRKAIRNVELTQGRWAMVGTTYFAFWEAISGKPIIENNPFFHPNAILPLAAVAYFVWSQFYQISNVREYPIRVEYTKDREELLRSLKRTIAGKEA